MARPADQAIVASRFFRRLYSLSFVQLTPEILPAIIFVTVFYRLLQYGYGQDNIELNNPIPY